jgi:hypothetical protein
MQPLINRTKWYETEQSVSDEHFPTCRLLAIQFGPHVCFVTPRKNRLIKLEAIP